MLKIFSWNVNGLRAVLRKGALQKFITEEQPDILCLQETKAKQGQAEIDLPEYEEIWNSAERPGYAGTAIFTKIKPLSVKYDLPTEVTMADEFGDPLSEGRVLTAEFDKFYLVNVYTPNSKNELERLGLREKKWDPEFLRYLKELEKVFIADTIHRRGHFTVTVDVTVDIKHGKADRRTLHQHGNTQFHQRSKHLHIDLETPEFEVKTEIHPVTVKKDYRQDKTDRLT